MKRKLLVVMVSAGLMLLQGCTGETVVRDGDVPLDERGLGAEQGIYGEQGAQASGVEMGGGEFAGRPIGELLNDPNTPLSRRVFYFEYNSAELSEEDRNALSTHARLMNERRDVAVVLEGHADERGSREYNLALGERRAKVIERVLTLQGVAPEQIQVISFGEERPKAYEHDEASWRLNRRVELLYSGY